MLTQDINRALLSSISGLAKAGVRMRAAHRFPDEKCAETIADVQMPMTSLMRLHSMQQPRNSHQHLLAFNKPPQALGILRALCSELRHYAGVWLVLPVYG